VSLGGLSGLASDPSAAYRQQSVLTATPAQLVAKLRRAGAIVVEPHETRAEIAQ
jgi:hypothetical protein